MTAYSEGRDGSSGSRMASQWFGTACESIDNDL